MGELYGSFESMHGYLNTVADQADALAPAELRPRRFFHETGSGNVRPRRWSKCATTFERWSWT